MDEPVSWAALEVVEARLKEVSIATGYKTDIGIGDVTLDPRTERKTEDGIITLITSGDIRDIPASSGKNITVTEMDLVIEVIVPFAAEDNPALIAHRARADIYRAMRGGIRNAERGVRSVVTTGSSFSIGNDGGAVVIVQVSARAGLAETTPPAP